MYTLKIYSVYLISASIVVVVTKFSNAKTRQDWEREKKLATLLIVRLLVAVATFLESFTIDIIKMSSIFSLEMLTESALIYLWTVPFLQMHHAWPSHQFIRNKTVFGNFLGILFISFLTFAYFSWKICKKIVRLRTLLVGLFISLALLILKIFLFFVTNVAGRPATHNTQQTEPSNKQLTQHKLIIWARFFTLGISLAYPV